MRWSHPTWLVLAVAACGSAAHDAGDAPPGSVDAAPGSADARADGQPHDTTPWFRSDCATPQCGFPQLWNQYEGVLYDTTIVDGLCPDGSPAARITYRPGPFDPGIVQHPIGFGLQGIGTPPTQGMELYVRWRARFTNMYPGGPLNLGWGGKFIMIADQAGNEGVSRLILNARDNGVTAESTAYEWMRNIDGVEHGTGGHEVPVGEWTAGQLWVRTSSTTTSGDAQLKIWLDGDNASEATPTGVSPATFAVDVTNWAGGNTRFGGFVSVGDEGADTLWDPAPIIEICGFELDDEFDPLWND